MPGIEIRTDGAALNSLDDLVSPYFTTVRDDALLAYHLFGKDMDFSRKDRRGDRSGQDLGVSGSPAIDPAQGASVGNGFGYFDTGVAETEAMTVMVAVQVTQEIVAGNENRPFVVGGARTGLDGLNLHRGIDAYRFRADWDVSGTDTHSEPTVPFLNADLSPALLFASVDADEIGLYDETNATSQKLAKPAGAAGRFLFPSTLTVGSTAAVYTGPCKVFALAMWDTYLTDAERAKQVLPVRKLLANFGIVV